LASFALPDFDPCDPLERELSPPFFAASLVSGAPFSNFPDFPLAMVEFLLACFGTPAKAVLGPSTSADLPGSGRIDARRKIHESSG
jgi:hypothetical protein